MRGVKKGMKVIGLAIYISLIFSFVSYAEIYTYDPALAVTSDRAFREMAECGQWYMDYDGGLGRGVLPMQ